ncbi:MAG: MFS transporter, partial [Waterburya sp.]
MKNTAKKVGFSVFLLVWIGQVVSLTGSRLTNFALGVWVYQNTGSATQYALISIFAMLPLILISPIAGFLVDRQDRRSIMIASDIGSGITTVVVALVIVISGHLSVWQIYLATGLSSIFTAFQWPAYIASIPHLVSKQHFGRAHGMIELGEAVAYLLSPALAGVLLITIQLQGIILIDFVTFLFSLITLLSIRSFPVSTVKIVDTANHNSSLLKDLFSSWSYLTLRPGLIGLVLFFAGCNFLMGVITVLVPPLLLSFTSPNVMGTVVSIIYSGIVFGSLVMSTWGGWQQKMMTIFHFTLLTGLGMIAAGWRSSIPLFTLAGFLIAYSMPIIRGSSQVIFNQKILPAMQGRVFA